MKSGPNELFVMLSGFLGTWYRWSQALRLITRSVARLASLRPTTSLASPFKESELRVKPLRVDITLAPT